MLNFHNGFATFSIKIFCLLSTYLIFIFIFVFDLKDHVLSPNIIDAVIDKIKFLAAFLFLSTGVHPDKIEVVLFLISFLFFFYLYLLANKFLVSRCGMSSSGEP